MCVIIDGSVAILMHITRYLLLTLTVINNTEFAALAHSHALRTGIFTAQAFYFRSTSMTGDSSFIPPNDLLSNNTLWCSPYDVGSPCFLGDDGRSMSSHKDQSHLSEAILSAQIKVSLFWKMHEKEFRAFWFDMRHQSRENFVRSVHPSIVQSLRDRYCIITGMKVYEDRHDRDLLLIPKLSIEGLISGHYLLDLIEIVCTLESVQNLSNKMILDLRKLLRYKKYTLTSSEEEEMRNEVPARIGQTFVMQGGRTFGFRSVINDSTIIEHISSGQYNLFKLGKLSYNYEFKIVSASVYLLYTVIIPLLEEFKLKVLGIVEFSSLNLQGKDTVCGFCGASESAETTLKQCRQCLEIYYCSM